MRRRSARLQSWNPFWNSANFPPGPRPDRLDRHRQGTKKCGSALRVSKRGARGKFGGEFGCIIFVRLLVSEEEHNKTWKCPTLGRSRSALHALAVKVCWQCGSTQQQMRWETRGADRYKRVRGTDSGFLQKSKGTKRKTKQFSTKSYRNCVSFLQIEISRNLREFIYGKM